MENLNFGQAIEALKNGKRVARKGWNGKGMYLVHEPGHQVKREDVRIGRGAVSARCLESDNPKTITIGAHIDMRAADGSVVVGWLASQTDMLSNDWCVLGY